MFAFYTVRDWRSRYRNEAVSTPIAFSQKRLEQFLAAAALPTVAEQRRAMRPLVRRGYVRMALLLLGIVLIIVLAPWFGIVPALLASFALVGGAFLILHRLVDL